MACGAHFAPSCGTEPRGCAEGCTHCAVEPALEVELQREKAGQSNGIRDSVQKNEAIPGKNILYHIRHNSHLP